MPRRALPFVVAAVIALGLMLPRSLPLAAQEGTPAASPAAEPELPPGVGAAFIAGAPVTKLPADADLIVLVRLTLAPGAILPADPNDPTGGFVVVESGVVTVRSVGPLTISRATGPDEDFKLESIAADTAATLRPGDALYVGPFQATEARNDGDGPAAFLLVNIGPEEGMGPPSATPAA